MTPSTPRRTFRLPAAALGLAVLAAACGSGAAPSPSPSPSPAASASPLMPVVSPTPVPVASGTTAERRALDDAQDRWRATAATAYVFTLTRQCNCMVEWSGPFRIEVAGGTVSVTRAGAPVDASIVSALPATAEALFDHLRQHVADKDYRATFDPETGFPLSFWSDPMPEAADDELGFELALVSVTR